MDLIDTLRSTGAVREFTATPVADAAVARILDTARFAPSGANAQAWHVVVVKDPALRTALRDLYRAGLARLPGDECRRSAALGPGQRPRRRGGRARRRCPRRSRAAAGQGFAGQLDRVPVLLVVFADLAALAAVDRDLDRYSFAGGASVYPFAWNILLAARAEGLGGVLTTMLIRREDDVSRLLGAPGSLGAGGRHRTRPPGAGSPRGCDGRRWSPSPPSTAWTVPPLQAPPERVGDRRDARPTQLSLRHHLD